MNEYFKKLQSYDLENITEHTLRSNLENFVSEIPKAKKLKIIHEPKRKERYGAPDFQIENSMGVIGYIETKKIGENLDKIINSKQLKRYCELSSNILLTNYTEFILIKNSKVVRRENLCSLSELKKKNFKLDSSRIKNVELLINNFLSSPPKGIESPKELAEALATRCKWLKEILNTELSFLAKEGKKGRLYGLYDRFQKFISKNLTLEEFSDQFAQTLVYGLFLAKLNAGDKSVNLYDVKKYIPYNFSVIKELVEFLDAITQKEYKDAKWIVDEILSAINHVDLDSIKQGLKFSHSWTKDGDKEKAEEIYQQYYLREFPKIKNTDINEKKANRHQTDFHMKDPYIYFYEDFLSAYDSKLREKRGVYYTPPPVVNFIVRAVDDSLKQIFGLSNGLAEHNKVSLLDFACGTGTFILEVFEQVLSKIPKDSAKKSSLIKEHLLQNVYGFEYLIAPYTVAHLKLWQYLKDIGYKIENNERMRVYLTNTLEQQDAQADYTLPALTDELRDTNIIKKQPILCITGNPPYSGHSANKGKWIQNQIKDNYYHVDGKPLNEKASKWLQDDYVKFIRFAQDKIDQQQEGVVAIITNHSFLDNPTFRGMRKSLMNTFNYMFFIDLHGNAKKKEKAPDGSKDENVFDIQQGTAISIMIKAPGHSKVIRYVDMWGKRTDKYNNLSTKSLEDIDFKEIEPSAPFYLFKPQDKELKEKYYEFFSIKDIFKEDCVGITTARDKLSINFEKESLENNIKDFKDLSISDKNIEKKYGVRNNSGWNITTQRGLSSKKQFDKNLMKKIGYRIFDDRFVYYDDDIVFRTRKKIMKHMFEKNIALICPRQVAEGIFNHNFITENIIECRMTLSNKGIAYLFPLYTCTDGSGLFEQKKEKRENFNSLFRRQINKKYGCDYSPEKILGYIYAIMHSNLYRKKYSEFLKIDFPKIPFTDDNKLFEKLSDIGWDLTQNHLLKETPTFESSDFKGNGDNKVEKVIFVSDDDIIGKIYINSDQYFDNISKDVWDFYIGGYQVLDKYLKSRKDRKLTLNEIEHVEKIAKVLKYTIQQMKKVDELVKDWI